MVPQWSTHVGNNTVLEDDVVFLHKQEELAVAKGLGRKPVAQVTTLKLDCTMIRIIDFRHDTLFSWVLLMQDDCW